MGRMTLYSKLLIMLALLAYGVLGRNTDSKHDFFKDTYNKKSGSMLMDIAKELVHRSSSTSQVSVA